AVQQPHSSEYDSAYWMARPETAPSSDADAKEASPSLKSAWRKRTCSAVAGGWGPARSLAVAGSVWAGPAGGGESASGPPLFSQRVRVSCPLPQPRSSQRCPGRGSSQAAVSFSNRRYGGSSRWLQKARAQDDFGQWLMAVAGVFGMAYPSLGWQD